jgi:hypothetical protein
LPGIALFNRPILGSESIDERKRMAAGHWHHPIGKSYAAIIRLSVLKFSLKPACVLRTKLSQLGQRRGCLAGVDGFGAETDAVFQIAGQPRGHEARGATLSY